MRKVFSNPQVCHIWAQQTQSEGRGPSIFFRDSMIFSYGEHYLMAKVHTHKGKRFALVNSTGYSVTTAKHTRYVWSALHNLMPAFHSPDASSVKAAILANDNAAKGAIQSALKKLKVNSQRSIDWQLECINEAYKTANELRTFLGKAKIKPAAKDIAAVKAHLKKRLARYQELNTPEMRAKAATETAKRNARKEELARASIADKIEAWRKGENVSIYGLNTELLRVQGESVKTSRGAEVPLREAVTLYRAIEAGKSVLGAAIGHFQVVGVTDTGTDKVIKIGCHSILLSEARAVLGMKQAS